MGHIYKLPDGTKETLLNFNVDFINLIKNRLGEELATYVEEHIQSLQDQADYTTQQINTDLEAYESELDEIKDIMRDIYDILITVKGLKSDYPKLKDAIRNLKDYV